MSSEKGRKTDSFTAPVYQLLAEENVLALTQWQLEDSALEKRVTVFETDFKYPFIRLEEFLTKDRLTEEERIVSWEAMVANHVFVRFFSDVAADKFSDIIQPFGKLFQGSFGDHGLYLVKLKGFGIEEFDHAIQALSSKTSFIAYTEPDYLVQLMSIPNDPRFSEQWGARKIENMNAPGDEFLQQMGAGKVGVTGSEIVVSILDTGVDHSHEDLNNNIWLNKGESGMDESGKEKATNGLDDDDNGFVDDYSGWDFYNADNDPLDDHGHGTHVAGVFGAVTNNKIGIAGICRTALMAPIKFLNSKGLGTTSDAIKAIFYSEVIGSQISMHSWGGSRDSQSLLAAINAVSVTDQIFVVAAGNEHENNDSRPVFPASYENDNILSVTAVNSNDELAGFANYGPNSVDVAAPGVRILSTLPNQSYGYFDGTSMAVPHVAGALAVLEQHSPDLTGIELIRKVLSSVDRIPNLEGVCRSAGRVNLRRALELDLVASFTVGKQAGTRPFFVTFNDESTGNIERRSWDFGDGTPSSTSRNPSHVYRETGIFKVTLTIEGDGQRSQSSREILVFDGYMIHTVPFGWTNKEGHEKFFQVEDDGVTLPQALPFPFEYFGSHYTKIFIGADGYIGFSSDHSLPKGLANQTNKELPDPTISFPTIFPFWDDLNPERGGSIFYGSYGKSPHQKVVITWEKIPHFFSPFSPVTFQVVLHEMTNDIEFQFLEVQTDGLPFGQGKSATVGLQMKNGLAATMHSFNGNKLLENNMGLLFSSAFGETGSVPHFFPIECRKGWNLISSPLEPVNHELAHIFAGFQIHAFRSWNSRGNKLESAENMDANIGYWAFSKENATIPIRGELPKEKFIRIINGWNLIGFSEVFTKQALEGVHSIWDWDSRTQSYNEMNYNDQLIPGKAYWIHAGTSLQLKVTKD